MKVKIYILFGILIISFGFLIFFFGSQNNSPENARNIEKVVNDTQLDPSTPYYTAAVVEIELLKFKLNEMPFYVDKMVDIINSPEVKEADIIVLPEAILNRILFDYVFMPKSTVFCDDPDAHYAFRNISCAARSAKKYVAMNIYARIPCSEDDQMSCGDIMYGTNLYNMMFIFDRNGVNIAKYRKYNPYSEDIQVTAEPEAITFTTDFNVTFGVIVCFDLVLDTPANILLGRGIRNFVFSTMWHNQLPYGTALQYQQMWAYANNVNLLAANVNAFQINTTGSGIYNGRAGALKVFTSEIPTTKVLVAKVPINLPSEDEAPITRADEEIQVFPSKQVIEGARHKNKSFYDKMIIKKQMDSYTVEFLDFSQQTTFTGKVCNNSFCCNYDVEISKNTDSKIKNGPTYSYAIAAFDDYHHYDDPSYTLVKMSICSLIGCTEMGDKHSCGKRFTQDVQHPYSIDKINLNAVFELSDRSNIFPSTITNDLYPVNVGAFEFNKSKLYKEGKYSASMNLKTPKSNLLTFALYARDYQKDKSGLVEYLLQSSQVDDIVVI